MLTIVIPGIEGFDNATQEFVTIGDVSVELEHSLVSLSLWESKWQKPFLGPEPKTAEETLGYIEAMCLTPNIPAETFRRLTDDNVKEINDYIENKMTASWINEPPGNKPRSREIVTAEVIYYWMIALGIPPECQYWHLNRLIMLIRVNNQKNAPAKKMTPAEVAAQHRRLNEERRKKYNTTG